MGFLKEDLKWVFQWGFLNVNFKIGRILKGILKGFFTGILLVAPILLWAWGLTGFASV